MRGAELVSESEDAVQAGFRGVEVILGTFEGSELFNRVVAWDAFDRKAGKIVGHSMESWGSVWRVLIRVGSGAD